jgi:hypothetical protein
MLALQEPKPPKENFSFFTPVPIKKERNGRWCVKGMKLMMMVMMMMFIYPPKMCRRWSHVSPRVHRVRVDPVSHIKA